MANKVGRIYGDMGCHMPCDVTTNIFEDENIRKQYLNASILNLFITFLQILKCHSSFQNDNHYRLYTIQLLVYPR